jgi:meiotic recombination protein SPO11
MSGSKNMSYDSASLTTPDIKWYAMAQIAVFFSCDASTFPRCASGAHISAHLFVCLFSFPSRLGVRPSDLDRYNIPEQCRLPMTEHDLETGRSLLKEEFIKQNPEWVRELELMQKTKEKAEIQALSAHGFQYLSQVYLPLKLQQEDWI